MELVVVEEQVEEQVEEDFVLVHGMEQVLGQKLEHVFGEGRRK